MIEKSNLMGILSGKIRQYATLREFVAFHNGGLMVLDRQLGLYQASKNFLEKNEVYSLKEILMSNPGAIYGIPEQPILEDIISWIDNSHGAFDAIELPAFLEEKQARVNRERAIRDAEEKRIAKIEQERLAAVDKKRAQDELCDRLGIDKDLLAKLRGQ